MEAVRLPCSSVKSDSVSRTANVVRFCLRRFTGHAWLSPIIISSNL